MAPNPSQVTSEDQEDQIQSAIQYYRDNPGLSQRKIVAEFNVPRATFQARLQGRESSAEQHAKQQRLTPAEEDALIAHCKQYAGWGWLMRISFLEAMA